MIKKNISQSYIKAEHLLNLVFTFAHFARITKKKTDYINKEETAAKEMTEKKLSINVH